MFIFMPTLRENSHLIIISISLSRKRLSNSRKQQLTVRCCSAWHQHKPKISARYLFVLLSCPVIALQATLSNSSHSVSQEWCAKHKGKAKTWVVKSVHKIMVFFLVSSAAAEKHPSTLWSKRNQ